MPIFAEFLGEPLSNGDEEAAIACAYLVARCAAMRCWRRKHGTPFDPAAMHAKSSRLHGMRGRRARSDRA
eukprot:COSAG01_NODE_61856_length_287_cov_1.106383_1_plen_69_part_10